MKKITLFFLFIAAVNSGECVITDKEYARLPPVFELDNFDRCMLLEDEALYCSMEFHLKPIDPKNTSKTWKQIQEINTDPKNYHHDNLRHGICVPFVCPNISHTYNNAQFKKDLAGCYNKKYEHLGVYGTVEYMHCQTNEKLPLDFYDTLVAIFLVLYTILIIYASFYEGLARYKSPEEYERLTSTTYGKILSCFSIPKNWYRLKSVSNTPDVEAMKGLQGVRFYNMFLVILAHSSLMATYGPVSNVKWAHELFENPLIIFIASGQYAVETFFLMSSWILSYNLFQHFNKQSGKELNLKTLFRILLYRYIRLTPLLAVMIIFHSTLMYHTGRGPWWELSVGRERDFCRENGWTNLLYINNLINQSRMCFVETWSLAVDMQGFVLSLAILYFSVKNPKRLLWIVPMVGFIAQGIHLKRIYEKNISYPVSPRPESVYAMQGLLEEDGEWLVVSASTAPNLIGTLVGLVTGYIFYKYRNEHNMFSKKIYVVLWWVLSFGMGISIILFPGMWIFSKDFYRTYWFSLPYFAFNTPIYGIAIAIGLLGFTKGIGWMARWTVEWNPIYFLSRLSYSTFCVHYAYIMFQQGTRRGLEYAVKYNMICDAMKTIVCSMLFGLVLTMTTELPVSALQSAFMKQKESSSAMSQRENENDDKQKKL